MIRWIQTRLKTLTERDPRVEEFRNAELLRISGTLIGFIAIPMVLAAINIDFSYGQHRSSWILIRVLFVPFALCLLYSYRFAVIKRNPLIPLVFVIAYITTFICYFATQTGYQTSGYWRGIIQVLIGISLFPLKWTQFLTITFSVTLAYVLTIALGSGKGWEVFTNSELTGTHTFLLLSILGFFVLHRLRFALYRKTIELNDELKNRGEEIKRKADELVRTKMSLEMEQLKVAHLDEINTITAQVSHDIRSPLAALDMISDSLKLASEDHRTIVRSATRRISDIAHVLLRKNQSYYAKKGSFAEVLAEGPNDDQPLIELLPSLLDSILAEKRTEFRGQVSIHIVSVLTGESYGIFGKVVGREFKRIISNLVNNAVEALGLSGTVEVTLSAPSGSALIEIRDNGKGISSELLPQLFRKGATFNKAGGTGLGLFHAKAAIASWQGDLRIESTPGRGTTVLLSLPLASVPLWFVPELTIERGSRIVVIDDDTSIHQVWMQRFSADLLQKYQLKLIHFSAPEQLVQLQASNHPTLYLCDYEFAQHQENGIDLIMQLNILKKSILVTSRFEEGLLLERCLSIGLKVLPKGMTGFVPIRFDGGLEH